MKTILTLFLLVPACFAQDRVIDKKFVIVHSIYAASAVADGLSTSLVLNRCPRCTEQTFWYGARPSNARIAGILGAEFALVTGFDYFVASKAPKARWVALILPTILTGGHGIGFSVNLGHLSNIRKNPDWQH